MVAHAGVQRWWGRACWLVPGRACSLGWLRVVAHCQFCPAAVEHSPHALFLLQSWRLQRAFAAWRDRTARCCQGRALLARMASAAQRATVQAAFTAWRQFLPQQRLRLESLTALVAARRRADLLQQALSAWRGAVDDRHGRRLQLAHAQLLLGRLRLRHALRAWRAWTEHRAERQRAWVQLLDRLRLGRLQRALVAWQEEVSYRRERQAVLMRWAGTGRAGLLLAGVHMAASWEAVGMLALPKPRACSVHAASRCGEYTPPPTSYLSTTATPTVCSSPAGLCRTGRWP